MMATMTMETRPPASGKTTIMSIKPLSLSLERKEGGKPPHHGGRNVACESTTPISTASAAVGAVQKPWREVSSSPARRLWLVVVSLMVVTAISFPQVLVVVVPFLSPTTAPALLDPVSPLAEPPPPSVSPSLLFRASPQLLHAAAFAFPAQQLASPGVATRSRLGGAIGMHEVHGGLSPLPFVADKRPVAADVSCASPSALYGKLQERRGRAGGLRKADAAPRHWDDAVAPMAMSGDEGWGGRRLLRSSTAVGARHGMASHASEIVAGDTIPSASIWDVASEKAVNIRDVLRVEGGRTGRAVLFAVPGAFTPVCSEQHLPGFMKHLEELKTKADVVACVAVNDPFVMKEWGKTLRVPATLKLLSDGNGELTKALGMSLDASSFFMGERSKRFAVIVGSNGKAEWVGKEEESFAEAVLTALG